MILVTASNFEDELPNVIQNISKAHFISFDCEFSGIHGDKNFSTSLLDNPENHYTKLRHALEPFTLFQFGLTTFSMDHNREYFIAHPYTFNIFPNSLPGKSNVIGCQIDSLKFLVEHQLDLNLVIRDGIGFITKSEEEDLLKNLKESSFMYDVSGKYNEENFVTNSCKKVANWASQLIDEDFNIDLKGRDACIKYMVYLRIRNRFPNLWTFYKDQNTIAVRRIDEKTKKIMQLKQNQLLEEDVKKIFNAFGQIIQVLSKSQKPIIGHNCLKDLLIMYQVFYEPLPTKVNIFKQKITELFPTIYDTKCLSYQIRRRLPRCNKWHSNALSELYDFFNSPGWGDLFPLFRPTIILQDGNNKDCNIFHNAGFDAYATGVCFLNLALLCVWWDSDNNQLVRPTSISGSSRIFAATKAYENHLNVVRCRTNFMDLKGPDPMVTRPPILHIWSTSPIDIPEISDIASSCSLQVDIRRLSKYRVILATTEHKATAEISKLLQKKKGLKVGKYRPFFHSPASVNVLWSGLTMSGVIFTFIALKRIFL